jgi:hypothetical protein
MTIVSLPFEKADNLCAKDTRNVINHVLMPWDQAKPKDFIGFMQGMFVPVDMRGPRPGRHQVLYRKTDTGAEWVRYRTLSREASPKLADAAHLSLMIIDDPVFDSTIEDAVADLNPENGETFHASVYFLPGMLAVAVDEIDEALEENDIPSFDQADNPSDYIRIFTQNADSSHQEIELLTVLQNSMRSLSAMLKLRTEDGSAINLQLDPK